MKKFGAFVKHRCTSWQCNFEWMDFIRLNGQANCCPGCNMDNRIIQLEEDRKYLIEVVNG